MRRRRRRPQLEAALAETGVRLRFGDVAWSFVAAACAVGSALTFQPSLPAKIVPGLPAPAATSRAHARRKFFQCLEVDSGRAMIGIGFIGLLDDAYEASVIDGAHQGPAGISAFADRPEEERADVFPGQKQTAGALPSSSWRSCAWTNPSLWSVPAEAPAIA